MLDKTYDRCCNLDRVAPQLVVRAVTPDKFSIRSSLRENWNAKMYHNSICTLAESRNVRTPLSNLL